MSTLTWTHGKFTITMQGATFVAKADGAPALSAASLGGIKKKIDKLGASGFNPFPVIWHRYYMTDPQYLQAVGIKTTRGRKEFILSNGVTASSVTIDTPANRKAIDAWRKLDIANAAKIEKLRDETRLALEKIVKATP